MKQIRVKQRVIQEISRGKIASILLSHDHQDITVDDEVELANDDSHEVVGRLLVHETLVKRLSEFHSQRDLLVDVLDERAGDPTKPAKRISFSFKPYAKTHIVEQSDVNLLTDPTEVKLYADGGSRGNPGPSASGWVLYDMDDNVIKQNGFYLGITTNNQAEYQALRLGLEDAKLLRCQTVQVYMDSLLVVNQMKGIFKVKNRDLWPIHQAIKGLVAGFHKVTFSHVPRELNKAADRMVNDTLDAVR